MMAAGPSTRPETDYTVPVPWVIVIEAMNHAKALEIGRLLGKNGVTGRFLEGTVAKNLNKYAQLKKQLEERGIDMGTTGDGKARGD